MQILPAAAAAAAVSLNIDGGPSTDLRLMGDTAGGESADDDAIEPGDQLFRA